MPIFAYLTSTSTPLHLTNNNVLLVACRGHRYDHFFGAPLGAGKSAPLAQYHSAAGRKFWGLEQKIRPAARQHVRPSCRHLGLPPPEMAPCSARCRASASCSAAVLSLRADLRQSLSTRELRASRSLSGSLEERTNQQYAPQELLGFLLKTFFSPLPLPGAAGLKKYGPAHQGRGIACAVLEPAL